MVGKGKVAGLIRDEMDVLHFITFQREETKIEVVETIGRCY